MTSYERVKALLNREISDKIGLSKHFCPETLRDYRPRQEYSKGGNQRHIFLYGGCFNTEPFIGKEDY